jgi:hypothetical protein
MIYSVRNKGDNTPKSRTRRHSLTATRSAQSIRRRAHPKPASSIFAQADATHVRKQLDIVHIPRQDTEKGVKLLAHQPIGVPIEWRSF